MSLTGLFTVVVVEQVCVRPRRRDRHFPDRRLVRQLLGQTQHGLDHGTDIQDPLCGEAPCLRVLTLSRLGRSSRRPGTLDTWMTAD